MKKIKLSFLKRIFVLFCSTVILSFSVFLSYQNTVYASDTEWDDAAKAGIVIAGTIAGLFFVPELTAPIVIGALVDVGYNSVTIGKYIYENEDGTYTINEDFIQAVMDAAQQLEDQGFTDSSVEKQGDYLYNYKWTVTNTYMYNHPYKTQPESHQDTYNRSCELNVRVAGCNSIYTDTASNGRTYTSYSHYVYRYDPTYGYEIFRRGGSAVFVTDGNTIYSNVSSSSSDNITSFDGTQSSDIYSVTSSFGGNFPIFTDLEAVKNYLKTGKGYKDAVNYRPTPLFRQHSSYTPIYSGGSVTVNRTVINNINQKIAEVDSDDSLTDDQKIEILQQYIYSGGTSGTGGGGSENYPGHTDYEDNKDVPPGTDLTDTNSWLKKIYLKVCQIYDRMHETVVCTGHIALDSIQSKLDEISETLKKIKGWTIADTIIDGVDAVADWASFIKDLISDVTSGVSAVSSTMAEAADLMKTKFPFCLPWDVALLVTFLAHEPQTPVFQLPIIIENFGIEEHIIIDMTQFSAISTLSRTMLSLIYCYGLINLTFKVILMVKEES